MTVVDPYWKNILVCKTVNNKRKIHSWSVEHVWPHTLWSWEDYGYENGNKSIMTLSCDRATFHTIAWSDTRGGKTHRAATTSGTQLHNLASCLCIYLKWAGTSVQDNNNWLVLRHYWNSRLTKKKRKKERELFAVNEDCCRRRELIQTDKYTECDKACENKGGWRKT